MMARHVLPVILLGVGTFNSPDGRTNALRVDGEAIVATHCDSWIPEDPLLHGHPCTPLGVRREGMPEENPFDPGRGGLASSIRLAVTSRTGTFLPGAGNCATFILSGTDGVERDAGHLCFTWNDDGETEIQLWGKTNGGFREYAVFGPPSDQREDVD